MTTKKSLNVLEVDFGSVLVKGGQTNMPVTGCTVGEDGLEEDGETEGTAAARRAVSESSIVTG